MYKSKTIFSKYGNKVFAIIIFLYILLIFYFKKVEKNEEKKLHMGINPFPKVNKEM